MDIRSVQRRRVRLLLSGLLAFGTVALALAIFGISRGATAASGTTPDVDISAESLQLSPGDTLSVKIRVSNPLTSTLSRITIKLDYDSGQLTPIESDFSRDSDWVSDLSDSRVSVTFKDIGAGKSLTSRVLFRVNQPAPGDTTVDLHAKFSWSADASASTPRRSGSGSVDGDEPLIVAPDGVLTDPNVIDSAPQAAIEPRSGGVGSMFRAHASGFRGGERISIWLNTPNGVAAVPHDLVANGNGEVWPEFSSSGLAAGGYGLVIYGQESTQTLVVPFTVGAAAAPQPADAAQPAAAVPLVSLEPLGLWGASVPATSAPPQPAANIEPKNASAGTQFHAYAGGFQAGEPVSIWLNTPGGVQALDGSFTANSAGEVWPEFPSAGLAPGSYGLVIYGRSGGQTLVVPFAIV
jgi:hypothetical protein